MLHYEVGNDLTKPTGNRFNNNSFIINSAGEFVELSLTVRFFPVFNELLHFEIN